MSIFTRGKAEAGIAHVAVIVMLAVVVIGVGAMYVMVKNQASGSKNKDTTSEAEDLPAYGSNSNSSSSSLQVNQRNTSRRNDASKLLAAATEYMNNNTGHVPTIYENNRLSGGEGTTPNIVTFEMYKDIAVESGAQAKADANQLRLVTGAACGENGETVTASTRSLAAQFALEKVAGGYTYECQEG